MAHYVSTGKIHFPRTIGGLLFGITFALLTGLLYGWAMQAIPYIIVQGIVFVGVIMLLVVANILVVHIGLVRNNLVKGISVIILCLTAWYAQWVYTTQPTFWSSLLEFKRVFGDVLQWSSLREIVITKGFSDSGPVISGIGILIFDAIEFLAFMSPIWVAFKFSSDYFCEECKNFLVNSQYYTDNLDEKQISGAEATGDFRFVANANSTKSAPGHAGTAWYIDFSHCDKCNQLGVICISSGRIELDKKGKSTYINETQLTKHTLVGRIAVADLAGVEKH